MPPIILLFPESDRHIKWGAEIGFEWRWEGKLQSDQYLELRIDNQWYETVTQADASQVRARLDKLEKGWHHWSIVLMSRKSSDPIQQSERRWFILE